MSDIITSDLTEGEKDTWSTPQNIFEALNSEFNFVLDVCAGKNNYKCVNYITKEQNALSCSWWDRIPTGVVNPTVWVNPPYSRGMIKAFVNAALKQRDNGITSVMLVPLTPEALWFMADEVNELRIITGGRIAFVHPLTGLPQKDNPKGSMLMVFRPDCSPISTKYIDRDYLIELGNNILKTKLAA
jgi:phage N-6-adenine-methyltransferase